VSADTDSPNEAVAHVDANRQAGAKAYLGASGSREDAIDAPLGLYRLLGSLSRDAQDAGQRAEDRNTDNASLAHESGDRSCTSAP
jgi:hypothetical protein